MTDATIAMDQMLERWGEWSRQRISGAAGYPGISPMFKPRIPSSNYVGSMVLADDVALRVDQAVAKLKADAPGLHEVVMDWYVFLLPAETIARTRKCHLNTVYNRRLAAIANLSNVALARAAA